MQRGEALKSQGFQIEENFDVFGMSSLLLKSLLFKDRLSGEKEGAAASVGEGTGNNKHSDLD